MIETKSRFAITISLHEPVLAGEYSGFKLEGVMLRNCEKWSNFANESTVWQYTSTIHQESRPKRHTRKLNQRNNGLIVQSWQVAVA